MGQPFSERVLKHWIERLTPSLIQYTAITKLNDAMDVLQARYLKQFSAMQTIVNASKSTQDSLTQSMASWTAGLKA